MEDFNSMVGSMEKLNEYNYRDWKTCMRFYLKGHNLWEIVDGTQTSPPNKDDKSYESWNIKANKAMYILMTSMEKNLRARIAHVETPKEAWNILAALFANKSTARLQLLEKELMNTTQGTLSIKEYFLKVKNLCREIEEIDGDSKFGDGRIRRIIINGLNPEYNSFIAAIQGWQVQPSLVELENLLVDQEALSKRMSKVTIKSETEEALFSARKPNPKFKKGEYKREHSERKFSRQKYKSDSENEKDSDNEDHHHQHRQLKGECFLCGRKGHYARECKFLRKIQSNFIKMEHNDDASEEEWDFEATYAVEEDIPTEEEFDFEATFAVEEDVVEEEEWDVSEQNGELWIEDLQNDGILNTAASSLIMEECEDQYVNDVAIKTEDKRHVALKDDIDGFALSLEEIELVSTQPGVKEWLTNACIIKGKCDNEMTMLQGVQQQGELDEIIQTKIISSANMELKEKNSMVIQRMKHEENVGEEVLRPKKIEDHSKMKQNYSAQLNTSSKLIKGRLTDQVQQDKFIIGANIKRPPDREEELDIKGEY